MFQNRIIKCSKIRSLRFFAEFCQEKVPAIEVARFHRLIYKQTFTSKV